MILTPEEVAMMFDLSQLFEVDGTSETFAHRVFAKVNWNDAVPTYAPVLGPCAVWQAATNKGYGVIGRAGRGSGNIDAHLAVWWLVRGRPPAGLQADHLCRVPACVNPNHIEFVTQRENILRGFAPSALHARRTLCLHGHPMDGITVTTKSGKIRYCKTCKRTSSNARYHAGRAA